MGIRTIKYTLSADSISPANQVFGGTAGDHRPTRIQFATDDELAENLLNSATESGGTLYYRFDVYNGDTELFKTESNEVGESRDFFLPLEENVTRHGGQIIVYIVFTVIADGETELELYSMPARLTLLSRPGGCCDKEIRSSLTTIEEAAKEAARQAKVSEDNAKASELASASNADRTESAKATLDDGSTWIFTGNAIDDDERPEIDPTFAIDDELDANSTNAVENKKIYAEFQAIRALIAELDIDSIKAEIIASLFPVGSFFLNDDAAPDSDLDPNVWLTGTWELVKDKFILGAGDDYSASETGGEAEHTLTLQEMPEHKHNLHLSGGSSGEVISLIKTVFDQSYGWKDGAIQNAGGGQAHNNMPPYLVTYIWHRTA